MTGQFTTVARCCRSHHNLSVKRSSSTKVHSKKGPNYVSSRVWIKKEDGPPPHDHGLEDFGTLVLWCLVACLARAAARLAVHFACDIVANAVKREISIFATENGCFPHTSKTVTHHTIRTKSIRARLFASSNRAVCLPEMNSSHC